MGWRYTMGEQVPESFIMSQLLGLLLPSAKQPWQDDVPGKYTADCLKQDFFKNVLQENVTRSNWRLSCVVLLCTVSAPEQEHAEL